MELREYMSVRRAYNRVRGNTDAKERLSFEEFAILCRLHLAGVPLRTSDIATYQGALRPTMTHRTNHLSKLGLLDRNPGIADRRNVECGLSSAGEERVRSLCESTRGEIPNGQPLARTSADRICRYVDAMGTLYCTSGGLILLDLSLKDGEEESITALVNQLGLLQPTVSMSVGALTRSEKVERVSAGNGARMAAVRLLPAGEREAQAMSEHVRGIVVKRKPRRTRTTKKGAASGDCDAAGVVE